MTYTALGAALLWFGWFGFNGGRALAADGIAASAFCCTHFAAAAGAVAWACIEWYHRGKPTLLGACSGAVAGLVCITAGGGLCSADAGDYNGNSGGSRLLPRMYQSEESVRVTTILSTRSESTV